MDLRPSVAADGSRYPGRTYRFVEQPVLFRFGEGLSFTQFTASATADHPVVSRLYAINLYNSHRI
jgi:hypothetical protein